MPWQEIEASLAQRWARKVKAGKKIEDLQPSMKSELVAVAPMIAVWRRGKPEELLHHSDQGSQYTSEHFLKFLAAQGITCSMSRAGEVWDNSAMECFFSTLKMERVHRKV